MATPEPASWPRPYYSRGEGKAMLLFFVFGTFPEALELNVARYGSAGLPAGVEMHRFDKQTLAHWEGHPLRGAIGELLREDDPHTFKLAREASECIMLRGELDDPPTLDYLRDTLGVIAALLDVGGIAVVDPQILSLFAPRAWGERYLIEGGAPPRAHALILCHDEDDGSAWVRTRGMRKFARPDISLRNVPKAEVDRAGALAEHLLELEAMGMRFADGTTLEVDGLPPTAPSMAKSSLVARHGGSLEDPQFNNTHVEFDWPK
ncbi:MAG TPA: hypothetical protein VFK08_09350 [Rhodanobacteraceae bacterium]|nr:hypothetical protein [Rhodanobacteraceae bacterium]